MEEEGFEMVRRARVVAPGIPHHITQRRNRRQETFFCAEDYQAYSVLRGWGPDPARRRKPGVFTAMHAPGGPWGASYSPWQLKGNSAGRCGGESRGPRAAALHR